MAKVFSMKVCSKSATKWLFKTQPRSRDQFTSIKNSASHLDKGGGN